jgi:folate-binding protein YgfZ
LSNWPTSVTCSILDFVLSELTLRERHLSDGARFLDVNGAETVESFGDPVAEHAALRGSAGLLDLSGRSRLCLLGADRQRFLNGQVTSNVAVLGPGEGCYAALVNAKGRMQSDLNVYCLPDEILLDFEPGYGESVSARLEQYIIADDVQVVSVAKQYGLLTVQGPKARDVVTAILGKDRAPDAGYRIVLWMVPDCGEVWVARHDRTSRTGFDFFVPDSGMAFLWGRLREATGHVDGRACGWTALEWARIEAGIPRYGQDMDVTNLAPETGIEDRAISRDKGCYIGQEVIARIRTYGQVTKALRGMRVADEGDELPERGDKLFKEGREVGYVTSAARSPVLGEQIALGYVRREVNAIGTELRLQTEEGARSAVIVPLPFV